MLLVALGAPRHAAAQAAVAAHAEALRAAGGFADVRAAFLAAAPGIGETFAALRGDPICVVPMLMAGGYFARTVLPRAIAAADAGGRSVVLAPPLGLEPGLAALVARRAAGCAQAHGMRPAETGLLLIGHGSASDPASREATQLQAARIAALRCFARVEIALLETPPRIADQLRAMQGDLVVASLFATPGMHADEDVPRVLAADPRAAERRVVHTGAIGAAPEVAGLLHAMARAALDGSA